VEAGYFLDRSSGEPLQCRLNPLIGLEIVVRHYRSWAHLHVCKEGLDPIFDATRMAGATVPASMGPPTVLGARVWMHENLIREFSGPPPERFTDPLQCFGPRLTATSFATRCAALADLSGARLAFVPATLSYQTIANWHPFMRMGSTPGVISRRMFGVKMESVSHVPTVLRDYPDLLVRATES
jgi:hypothetical protein